jgi:DNA-binding NtrC family response regulator
MSTLRGTDRPSHILVVEDDEGMRGLLADELRERASYEVTCAEHVAGAREALRGSVPDLVIADLELPDGKGTDLLDSAAELPVMPAFMVITAFGTVPQAVAALQRGADDFITKPLDLDHLALRIERLLDVHRLKSLVARFRSTFDSGAFHGMIGRSPGMQQLFVELTQVARASGPVLVVGESGVGKEMVARALHEESARAAGPFVPVNCAAIPEPLVESELFGHVPGAFTGADRRRPGLFAEAEGGTLFLDEITELPLALQAKLLRVLQEGAIRPVGAERERAVDVRVICATNKGVLKEVEAGRFREDLYYRLETFILHIPPLRDRGDDIDLLAARFLAAMRIEQANGGVELSEEAAAALRSYPFPGNVRELQNIVERAVTFCSGDRIEVAHLGPSVVDHARAGGRAAPVIREVVTDDDLPALEDVKQRYVRYVLERLGGNKRRAAVVLGIGRRTLYRYLEPGG